MKEVFLIYSNSVSSFSPCCCYTGCHQGVMFGLTVGETRGGRHLIRDCGYELIQGWLRHSPAEALFSGTISSMGRRKWVKWPASSCAQPYFSTSTSNRDHGFSLVMCRSSPFLEKNSRLYFPAATTLRGTFPRSSMIRAMWSAHHHIHHRGNRHGSALQHAHTHQHDWLYGTDTLLP